MTGTAGRNVSLEAAWPSHSGPTVPLFDLGNVLGNRLRSSNPHQRTCECLPQRKSTAKKEVLLRAHTPSTPSTRRYMRFDGTATATATATVSKPGEGRRPALMWLSPSASMDITNILNRKGSAAAAAMAAAVSASNADPHLHQLAHVVTRSPSESSSERHSAYGPDPSSHYSSRTAHALHAMANLHSELRYSSPTSMHAPLPHFPPGIIPTGTPFESAMVPNEHPGSPAPPLPSPTTKAFPCTSCGKGFARRSDLARHGK